MAAKCLTLIHLCRLRVTRLDAVGNPVAGPNNVYVTDQAMRLNVTPEINEGEKRSRRNGCDCLVASLKTDDLLEYVNFELEMGTEEPGLAEMLTGATIIMDPDAPTDPIGFWHPTSQFDCATAARPLVAIEAWQHTVDKNRFDADFPYFRWVYPASKWRPSDQAAENDFATVKYEGYSVGNDQWGEGPFHDQPEAAQALGGGFYDTAAHLPTAACGYQSHAIT